MSAPRISAVSTRGLIAAVAAFSLAAIGLVVADPAAAATTITVGTTADGDANGACSTPSVVTTSSPVTLRNALCVASNIGGESTITVPGGTYALSDGALVLGTQPGTDVRLEASGGRAGITGNGSTQLLTIDPGMLGGVAVEIDGFAFTGGRDSVFGGGAIIGGSFDAATPDSLVVRDTRFIDNASAGGTANPGGAIQFIGGDLTIVDAIFTDNDSGPASGGAVYYEARSAGDALSVTGSSFDTNSVTASAGIPAGGGAIAFDANGVGTVEITGNTFTSNTASSVDGSPTLGGAVQQVQGPATVSKNSFAQNIASGAGAGGGALDAADGSLTARFNSFVGNVGGTSVRTTASAPADATNNWWGCNDGLTGCDSAGVANGATTPRLVLTATSIASTIETSAITSLIASLRTNSAGSTISTADLAIFENSTVSWGSAAPAGSSVTPATSPFHLGEATSTFTSGTTGGAGGATATYGAASVPVAVGVRQNAAFTSATTAGATVGSPFTFTVTTSGFPAPTVALTSGALPADVTFTPSGTGAVIAGTPTSTGSFPLTLTAQNGGTPVQQTLTITVGAAPAFTGSLATTVADGDPVDVTISTTGAPTPTIAATGALPAGLALDDNGDGTARLRGTPTGGPGDYVIGLTATNALGTAAGSFTLTVTAPPAFTSADHTTFTVGTAGEFAISVDPGFPLREAVSVSGAPAWLSLTGAPGAQKLVGTPPSGAGGVFTFDLTIEGSSVLQHFTLTVVEAPVITDQPDPVSVIAGHDASFTATATGYPAPSIHWQRFVGGSWMVIPDSASSTLTFETTVDDDGARVRAVFSSSAGAVTSDEAVLTVGEVPVLDPVDPVTAPVGTAVTVDVTSTGHPVSTLTASGLPSWLSFADGGDGTATLTGTPALADAGLSEVVVTATNAFGSDDITVRITVVGAVPAFTGSLAASVDSGDAVDVTITAAGTPDPTITASSPLPAGLSLDGDGDGAARLHGTPTVAPGVYSIGLVATNVHGAVPATFALTVTAAPEFTSADRATFTVGAAGEFPITVDPGYPVKDAVSVSGAPAWLSLTGAPGAQKLVGTPPAGAGGPVSFDLTIDGSSVVQHVTLTVREAPEVSDQPASLTVLAGEDAVFTAAANGHPAPSVQWQRFSGGSWNDLSGETASTLSFETTLADDGARLRAVFTNSAGSATSDEAVLTIRQKPAFEAVDPITTLAGAALTVDITSTALPVSVLTATGVPAWLTFTDAGDGTATLTGTPGLSDAGEFEITVTADNGIGTAELTVSITVAATVPLPEQLPAVSDGALTGVPPTVVRGQKLTIGGSGFLPGAVVQLGIYSTPTALGRVIADSTGAFSTEVTIPAGQSLGSHTLAASGVGAAGTPRLLTASTTVVSPDSNGGGDLSATGLDATGSISLALFALFTVLAGLALIRMTRRRSL